MCGCDVLPRWERRNVLVQLLCVSSEQEQLYLAADSPWELGTGRNLGSVLVTLSDTLRDNQRTSLLS